MHIVRCSYYMLVSLMIEIKDETRLFPYRKCKLYFSNGKITRSRNLAVALVTTSSKQKGLFKIKRQ